MRDSIILTVVFSILVGCKTSTKDVQITERDKVPTEIKTTPATQDTIYTVWELDFDTALTSHEVGIENNKHELDIYTYSLNDSSISWTNTLNKSRIFIDTYHDNRSDIYLYFKDDTVLTLSVDKETFKDSLRFDDTFYKRAILSSLEFEAIGSNRLYFNFTISIPDTDEAINGGLSVFFRTDKKGEMDYIFREVNE